MQRILKFADFLLEECSELDATFKPSSGADASQKALCEDIMRSQAAVKSWTQVWRRKADALLDEVETWKHKATILVQTVFTLATQRDADMSIQIAQDSRTLAQKATRDSTSMKAIAAVTMCFLPGTFVAVRFSRFFLSIKQGLTLPQSLFDMSMFEWPQTPGQTVSDHFWIYWAVTLPVTLVVVVIWLAWTNRKDMREAMRKAAKERRTLSKGKADV